MANKKDKGIISKNKKWEKESDSIKSIQLAFDFGLAIDTALRLAAARRHVPPSAIVREALGLSTVTPSRSRISLSVSGEELSSLGERYGVDPSDRIQIKKCIAAEIAEDFSHEDDDNALQTELTRAQEQIAKMEKESAKISASLKGFFETKEGGN